MSEHLRSAAVLPGGMQTAFVVRSRDPPTVNRPDVIVKFLLTPAVAKGLSTPGCRQGTTRLLLRQGSAADGGGFEASYTRQVAAWAEFAEPDNGALASTRF